MEQAFADAHKVARVELVNSRVVPNAMEPRAANAHYDVNSDSFTLYLTSQNPHVIRLLMGAYLSTFAPSIPTYFYVLMFSGQYRTPAIHVAVKAAFTHTAVVDAYRP